MEDTEIKRRRIVLKNNPVVVDSSENHQLTSKEENNVSLEAQIRKSLEAKISNKLNKITNDQNIETKKEFLNDNELATNNVRPEKEVDLKEINGADQLSKISNSESNNKDKNQKISQNKHKHKHKKSDEKKHKKRSRSRSRSIEKTKSGINEKSRKRSRSRDSKNKNTHRSSSKKDNSKRRSRSPLRRTSTSKNYSSNLKRRSRSRSRSKSRNKPNYKTFDNIRDSDYYNDKKKLLEIAKTNLSIFLEMQNLTNQNNIKNMEMHIKQQEQILSKPNPKSVDDFVEYCRKLSKTEDQIDTPKNSNTSNVSLEKSNKLSSKYDDRFAYLNDNANEQLALTFPNNQIAGIKATTETNIKIFPVSSGTKHRQVEIENKDLIENEKAFYPAHSNTNPDDMKIAIIDDPILKRPVKSIEEFGVPIDKNKQLTQLSNGLNSIEIPSAGPDFGKFTGDIDAKMLKPEELEGAFKAWTRKDLLTSAAPITNGIGKKILEKMGWKQGQGLGKNSEGHSEPIKLDIKLNRKGLVSQNENKIIYESSIVQSFDGKHPVSSLLELCRAKKWPDPVYDIASESGPDHLKSFLMRVKLNDVVYQPETPSQNKKLAKASAALHCLKSLGYINT